MLKVSYIIRQAMSFALVAICLFLMALPANGFEPYDIKKQGYVELLGRPAPQTRVPHVHSGRSYPSIQGMHNLFLREIRQLLNVHSQYTGTDISDLPPIFFGYKNMLSPDSLGESDAFGRRGVWIYGASKPFRGSAAEILLHELSHLDASIGNLMRSGKVDHFAEQAFRRLLSDRYPLPAQYSRIESVLAQDRPTKDFFVHPSDKLVSDSTYYEKVNEAVLLIMRDRSSYDSLFPESTGPGEPDYARITAEIAESLGFSDADLDQLRNDMGYLDITRRIVAELIKNSKVLTANSVNPKAGIADNTLLDGAVEAIKYLSWNIFASQSQTFADGDRFHAAMSPYHLGGPELKVNDDIARILQELIVPTLSEALDAKTQQRISSILDVWFERHEARRTGWQNFQSLADSAADITLTPFADLSQKISTTDVDLSPIFSAWLFSTHASEQFRSTILNHENQMVGKLMALYTRVRSSTLEQWDLRQANNSIDAEDVAVRRVGSYFQSGDVLPKVLFDWIPGYDILQPTPREDLMPDRELLVAGLSRKQKKYFRKQIRDATLADIRSMLQSQRLLLELLESMKGR